MEDTGIYARESTYLDRFVQVGAAAERVISCSFPERPEDAQAEHPVLDRIEAYLEGTEDSFADQQIGLTIPTDQRNVLEATREIPYGEEGSVHQVAQMAAGIDPNEDEDLRTVREALAANPIPLLIPDHRVRDGPSGAPPGIEQKLRSLENL